MRTVTVVALIVFSASASATSVYYYDEATFTAAANGLEMDSFEDLTGSFVWVEDILRPGFSMITSIAGGPGTGFGLFVQDADNSFDFGPHATDGEVFIMHQSGSNEYLRFDFINPVNAFGLTITDWDNHGDNAGVALLFQNNLGEEQIIIDGFPDAYNEHFFGVISDTLLTSVILYNTAPGEAYGVDGIYYGQVVPIPAALWLMLSGMAGLISIRPKNQRHHLAECNQQPCRS